MVVVVTKSIWLAPKPAMANWKTQSLRAIVEPQVFAWSIFFVKAKKHEQGSFQTNKVQTFFMNSQHNCNNQKEIISYVEILPRSDQTWDNSLFWSDEKYPKPTNHKIWVEAAQPYWWIKQISKLKLKKHTCGEGTPSIPGISQIYPTVPEFSPASESFCVISWGDKLSSWKGHLPAFWGKIPQDMEFKHQTS